MYQSELWGIQQGVHSESIGSASYRYTYECIPERFGSDSEPEFDLAFP